MLAIYPFWKDVVRPLIDAAGARRVLEIGALRGENTAQILSDLPRDTELHVIDPSPAFDIDDGLAGSGIQYVFHQDLSLNVLPQLGEVDVALIDGDHNWYTVYHELNLLHNKARQQGVRPPV